MPGLVEEGRAKVNLTLRVVGRRTDGYHDLESVVAFADCADKLTLTPGPELSLKTVGPLATACGELSDNLVLKAARLLGEVVPGLKAGVVLDKICRSRGIGGGLADAAPHAAAGAAHQSSARRRTPAGGRSKSAPTCRFASRACDMTGVGEKPCCSVRQ
jgi:4-diphosphocytidyl-2-C-methyl-D-erythritol kinase